MIPLAACTNMPVVKTPPQRTPVIEIHTGGGFNEVNTTRIYADDTIYTDVLGWQDDPEPVLRQGNAGSYVAAAAVISRQGPKAKAGPLRESADCLDYGVDYVKADPPIAGFDEVSSGCPDDAVTLLIDQVLAAIAAK